MWHDCKPAGRVDRCHRLGKRPEGMDRLLYPEGEEVPRACCHLDAGHELEILEVTESPRERDSNEVDRLAEFVRAVGREAIAVPQVVGLEIAARERGVVPEAVQVQTEGGILTIVGSRAMPSCGENTKIVRLEIPYGSFERRIALQLNRLRLDHRELVNGCLVLTFVKLG